MSSPRHVIRHQLVELSVPGGLDAHQIHEQVSRAASRFLPVIDELAGRLGGPDGIVRIDALEVDLGDVGLGTLEDDLVTGFARRFGAAVAAVARRGGAGLRADSQCELLDTFARQGVLPWWAEPSRPHLLRDALLWLVAEAPSRLSAWLGALAPEERPLRRLAAALDDASLGAWVAAVSPDLGPAGRAPAGELAALCERAGRSLGLAAAEVRRTFWQAALTTLGLHTDAAHDPPRFAREVVARTAAALGVPGATWREALGTAAGSGEATFLVTIAPPIPPGEVGREEETVAWTGDPDPPSAPALLQEDGASTPVPGDSRVVAIDRDDRPARASRGRSLAPDDDVFVDNAGLSLLWPFLPAFFERLGLLEGNGRRFAGEAAVQRAVGLLGHVATGEPEPVEYRLPLAKALCGMPRGEVFAFGPPVTDDEAVEATGLLRSVIDHATILREMTVDGLRGTFLLRAGVLGTRDGAGLLRVERQTYDVVLDRFPWTFGWVKLPWMKVPLRVEW